MPHVGISSNECHGLYPDPDTGCGGEAWQQDDVFGRADDPDDECCNEISYHLKNGFLEGNSIVEGDSTVEGDSIVEGDSTVQGDSTVLGDINCSGTVTAPTFQGNINQQSWKSFDIKHPSKKGYRLRYVCLEGPEAGVYARGRVQNTNIIHLPEFWRELVDADTISVHLTSIGNNQNLLVEEIKWGSQIKIKSENGSNIDCYYLVHGARKDGEPLIPEYEGESPADYPGDQTQFSISGHDYGRDTQ